MPERLRIGIVGGGLLGLFCAEALTDRGPSTPLSLDNADITIFDPGDPRKTAAYSAAAFVDPDWTDSARDIGWQRSSLDYYALHAADRTAGITHGPVHVFRRSARAPEFDQRDLERNEVLPPEFPHGTGFNSYRINPPVFLGWLGARLGNRGVQWISQEVTSFEQAKRECGANIIINATGVGARRLANDETVVSSRGHCARVHMPNVPQMVRLVAGEHAWSVATGADECRIGGTGDVDCWDLEPNQSAVDAMFRRVQKIMPSGFDPWANLLGVSCGLRPRRADGVRLEHEHLASGIDVVHCYGHGGEGFRKARGSAIDARNHVLRLIGAI